MSFNRLLLQIVCVSALVAAALAEVPNDAENEVITNDDLFVTLTTDKPVYKFGEPVMLFLKLRNLTGRKLEMTRQADILFRVSLTGGPYKTFNEVTDEHGNTIYVEDEEGNKRHKLVFVTNEDNGLKVPKTMYGKSMALKPRFEKIVLPPYGEYSSAIPLNALFDLNCPLGPLNANKVVYKIELDFPVWQSLQDAPLFTFNLESAFCIKGDKAYSSSALGDALEQVFGKGKSIDLLCDEAEDLILGMREHPEMQDEKSPEYRRLMIILRSLARMSQSSTAIWELEQYNRKTLDDFEKLVKSCRRQ